MKYFFILIHAVLIFLISDYGVLAVYTMITAGWAGTDPVAPLSDERRQQGDPRQYKTKAFYKGVTQRDLFGTEERQTTGKTPAKPAAEPVEMLKETGLKLDLLGTVTGTGTQPRALIRKSGQTRVGIYAVGDKMDDARIEAVMRMQVVLMVNGKKEVLRMKKNRTHSEPEPDHVSNVAGAMPPSQTTTPGGLGTMVLTQEEVTSLKDNLWDLKKQVRVKPYFHKNKIQGFRITRIKKDSVFYKKLGLRNGDIISGVNDQALTSIGDIARFYDYFNRVDGGATIDVQIKRHGTLGSLRYSIQ